MKKIDARENNSKTTDNEKKKAMIRVLDEDVTVDTIVTYNNDTAIENRLTMIDKEIDSKQSGKKTAMTRERMVEK